MMSDGSVPDPSGLPERARWEDLLPSTGKKAWGRWNHQYRAFRFLQNYLAAHSKDQATGAALVRMPTGAGKTGLMALTIAYGIGDGLGLIVAPSIALRDQIAAAVGTGYWATIRARPPQLPRAFTFVPSTLGSQMEEAWACPGPAVLVCTTSALAQVANTTDDAGSPQWSEHYETLRERTSVVLVDEGHREPAPAWARAIRRFDRPTILVTATPYRNDVRLFRVGKIEAEQSDELPGAYGDHLFVTRFDEVAGSGVIRTPKFFAAANPWASAASDEARAAQFVVELVSFHENNVASLSGHDLGSPKTVVRCGSYSRLQATLDLLRKMVGDKNVLAVHDRFDKDQEAKLEFKNVPAAHHAGAASASFWLHQDKLVEGIDNPSVYGLALETAFGNSRALVQQVGRLLRNPTYDKSVNALVLFDPADPVEQQWKGYEGYEAVEPPIVGPEQIVRTFLAALPDWFYSGRRYRSRADLEGAKADAILADLRFRASLQCFRRTDEFEADSERDLREVVEDVLEQHDYAVVRALDHTHGAVSAHVYLSLRVAETPRFASTSLFEIGFSPCALILAPAHVFFHGPLSILTPARRLGLSPVRPEDLERTLGGKAIVRQLSLANTDLGDYALRRRSIGANDIAKSGGSLTDHAHVVVTAVAGGDTFQRRALGMLRSRVSDPSDTDLTLAELCDWAAEIGTAIDDAAGSGPRVLRRFAEEVPAPDVATAKHVLIDLAEFSECVRPASDEANAIPFEETFETVASAVGDGGQFDLQVGGQSFTATLEYKRPRFRVSCGDLDKAFITDGTERRKPSTLLSAAGAIRVVTADRLLYLDRRFFQPRALWGPGRALDLDFVRGLSDLAGLTEGEKGIKRDPSSKKMLAPKRRQVSGRFTWPDKTLFALTDQRTSSIYTETNFDPDWIVCEDLNDELADFIAVDEDNRRVALLHCKAGKTTGSESTTVQDLHEVVSQAVKNLGLFDVAAGHIPERKSSWAKPWKYMTTKFPRIRHGPGSRPSASRFAKLLENLLRASDVRREVWVVLGNSMSASAVKKAAESTAPPDYQQIQLLYLLNSLHGHVTAFGARLFVLTQP